MNIDFQKYKKNILVLLNSNMDKYLKRNDSSSENTNTSTEHHDEKKSKTTKRKYDNGYLALGFTWTGDENVPSPLCIICNATLSNASMVPAKLSRHFTSKHSNLLSKDVSYFERLKNTQIKQANVFTKQLTVSEKAQEASFAVAELIAKKRKSHLIAESLILPACVKIVKIMMGDTAANEIMKVPLSDNTISRRIKEMSDDIEVQISEKLQKAPMFFSLQIDESTDISGKAQLLSFIRFIDEQSFTEQFFCCKELCSNTTGQEIFKIMNEYLEQLGMSWHNCVSICTDGAPSMVGSIKGFISFVKKQNPDITTTHCFLHREVLVAKSLTDDLKIVLDQAVKVVNYIKTRPQKTRIFKQLCESMDSEYKALLMHCEVRWLSKGCVLSRVYSLRQEVLIFLTLEESSFADCFSDEIFCTKLAFLTDLFDHLNKLNLSMQGANENLLNSTDKLCAFKEKLNLWERCVKRKDFSMFPNTDSCALKNNIAEIIIQVLVELNTKMEHYFPALNVKIFDWVRQPFIQASYEQFNLTLKEEENLIDIKNNRNLQLSFNEDNVNKFWIQQFLEDSVVAEKAIKILLPFPTSYLCEQAFSAMQEIKHKKRERLLSVEEELRVCLSKIQPRIKHIAAKKQAQVSH